MASKRRVRAKLASKPTTTSAAPTTSTPPPIAAPPKRVYNPPSPRLDDDGPRGDGVIAKMMRATLAVAGGSAGRYALHDRSRPTTIAIMPGESCAHEWLDLGPTAEHPRGRGVRCRLCDATPNAR